MASTVRSTSVEARLAKAHQPLIGLEFWMANTWGCTGSEPSPFHHIGASSGMLTGVARRWMHAHVIDTR